MGGAWPPAIVWLGWTLGDVAVEAWRRGEHSGQSAWNPLIWPFRAVICLGLSLLALQMLAAILKAARTLVRGGGGR